MNIASDIISRLAQALGRAQTDGTEQNLFVPHMASPVVQLVGPVPRFAGFVAAQLQRETFGGSVVMVRTASQATLTTTVGAFGAGLWQVEIFGSFQSDFTLLSQPATENIIVVEDPVQGQLTLIRFHDVANIPQFDRATYLWLLEEDSYIVRGVLAATGVAQNHEMSVGVFANRLL